MLKKNKLKAIISFVIILIPIIFGVVMWDDLPNTITTHFGVDGNADGFSGKTFVVFGISALFLVLHFITLLVNSVDNGHKEQTKKALGIIFWIIPAISVFVNIIIYSVAFEREINLGILVPALIGLLFVLMGNYMPKIKQNSTLGFKISWTLRNEENWNKTHRFCGKVMVAGGFVMLLSAFLLPIEASLIVLICVIASLSVFPILYSYSIYKKHKEEGISYIARVKSKGEKIFSRIGAVIVPVLLIGVAVLMFTGNIKVNCEENSFKISATYWTDIEVNYSEVDSVEQRKDFDVGMRTSGFSSAKLLMGIFKNEEFGSYTLYAYKGAKEFIVLTSDENVLVIGMKDTEDMQSIYDVLSKKIKG